MPSVPGKGGAVPKRSSQRRRVNKTEIEIAQAPAADNVSIPPPNPEWSPPATRWYLSLAESGQSIWFEPSDWAQAWIWTEFLSRALNQGERPSSQLIAAWSAGASELLTTEGARRRMRIELARAEKADADEDAAVAALDEYRARFSS